MYISITEHDVTGAQKKKGVTFVLSSQELSIKDVIGDLGLWKWPTNLCESILFQLERPSSFTAVHIV